MTTLAGMYSRVTNTVTEVNTPIQTNECICRSKLTQYIDAQTMQVADNHNKQHN